MSPSDLYFNVYLIIGFATIPLCYGNRLSADIAIIDDNGDWVILNTHQRSIPQYEAISKRKQPRNAANSFTPDFIGVAQTGSPKHFKYPLFNIQNDQRHRNRISQNGGQARQACPTTAPVPMKLVYGISKNGSEVEIQPGQVFMVIECDKIDRPPCYGFSHDRLSSWCETSHTAQYAFMRLKGTNLPWSLDHIMVPSGCLCYISERPSMSTDEEWQIEK